MRRTIASVLILPLLLATAGPRSTSPSPETFDWNTSLSAPQGAPMGVVAGAFSADGEAMSGIPGDADTHGGWGESGSAYVGGPDRKRAPDKLEVLFYSWLEDRFYQGEFKLPRERIAQLLREGSAQEKARTKGSHDELPQDLMVGVAPGGAVAVWAGLPTRTVEVFFGHAKPVDLDWHRTLDFPAETDKRNVIADELADDAKTDPLVPAMRANLPLGRWDAFRTRYRWRLRFEGVQDPSNVYVPAFVNGEADRSWTASLFGMSGDSTGPAPSRLVFTSQRLNRRWEIAFDEAESSDAFARAAASGARGAFTDLVITVPAGSGAPNSVTLTVQGPGGSVPLSKYKLDLFRAR